MENMEKENVLKNKKVEENKNEIKLNEDNDDK